MPRGCVVEIQVTGWHSPVEQEAAVPCALIPHECPHAPQFAELVVVSTHAPPQSVSPALQPPPEPEPLPETVPELLPPPAPELPPVTLLSPLSQPPELLPETLPESSPEILPELLPRPLASTEAP